jgi:PAS domain S-box-containing protein
VPGAGGEALGVLVLDGRGGGAPDERERAWVEAGARLAALAIGRDRGERALREGEARARHLARLHAVAGDVSGAIVREREPGALLDAACRIAVERGLARLAWVAVYRPDDDRLVPVSRFGHDGGYVDAILARRISLGDERVHRGPAARALQSGAPAVVNDVLGDPGFFFKDEARARGIAACAVFPLRLTGGARGVLALYGASPGFFGAEEVAVLGALADHLSLAAEAIDAGREGLRLFDELRASEGRLRLLHALGEAARTTHDPARLAAAAARMLGDHLGAARCAFVEVDAETGRCVVAAEHPGGGAAAGFDGGLGGLWAEASAAGAAVARAAAGGALVACARRGRAARGAMVVVERAGPAPWGDREVRLVEAFAEQCWAAVEQRAAEATAREREALLRIAGRAAGLGGFSIALPSGAVTWSDEVCAIHGVPAGTAPTAEQAAAAWAPEFRAMVAARVAACLTRGESFDLEAQLVTATGRRVWARLIGRAERDAAGAVARVQGALQDVSERRRMEEQLRHAQKMEAVGQLAGSIAHDFNNLLSVVLTYTQLIAESLEPADPLREDVEQIRGAGTRAAELTRQLLAFGRKQVLQPRVVDLGQVAAGFEKMLRRLLGDAIDLTLVPPGPLGKVLADPGQLEQVIMNLVVNARDAMPAGGSLTIETADAALEADEAAGVAAGAYVMLAVSDTGVGMDEATLAHIYEPYFTTKERGKGTGLGLSTVYGIVSQSGGHLRVESAVGAGTTLRVYLPCVDGARAAESVAPPPAATLRGRETVLVVEDDRLMRAVMRTILARSGYAVLAAENGGEAFLICEQTAGAIDLLVTDVVMPRMSGRELARRLTQARPAMRVILVSGHPEDAPAGGYAFLPKPITPDALLRRVREVLDAP